MGKNGNLTEYYKIIKSAEEVGRSREEVIQIAMHTKATKDDTSTEKPRGAKECRKKAQRNLNDFGSTLGTSLTPVNAQIYHKCCP